MTITYKPIINLTSFSCVEYHPEREVEDSSQEIFARIRDVVMRQLPFTTEIDNDPISSAEQAYKELERTAKAIYEQHLVHNIFAQHFFPSQIDREYRALPKLLEALKYGYRGNNVAEAEKYVKNLFSAFEFVIRDGGQHNPFENLPDLEELLERELSRVDRSHGLRNLKLAVQKLLYDADLTEHWGNLRTPAILWLATYHETSQTEKNHLLQISIIQGRTRAVEALLKQGVNPNATLEPAPHLDGSPGTCAFQQRVYPNDTFLSLAARTRRYHEKKTDKIIDCLMNHGAVLRVTELREQYLLPRPLASWIEDLPVAEIANLPLAEAVPLSDQEEFTVP